MEKDTNVAAESNVKSEETAGGQQHSLRKGQTQSPLEEGAGRTYDQAYIDMLLADQKAAQDEAVKEALKG